MASNKSPFKLQAILENYKESKLINANSKREDLWLSDIPTIPIELIEQLPITFSEYLNCFDDDVEKQVNFVGYLALLSACLPNVVGLYDNSYVESNLYLYGVGPFGSGKGQLDRVRKLFTKIHTKMHDEFKQLQQAYNEKKMSGDENIPVPLRKFFFIPANNSKSGFIELLYQSNGRGVLFETESDTLADSFKQDYGNFSDDLRKIYHSEPVSFYRRGGKELIEIDNAHLSVLLAGTYDQLGGIFKRHSNGLMSRFLFYNICGSMEFKDVFAKKNIQNLRAVMTEKSEVIYTLYKYLINSEKAIHFDLTGDQRALFVEYFNRQKEALFDPALTVQAAYVNRWGLMAYKIMMILTAVRKYERGEFKSKLTCADHDFCLSIMLYEIFRDHFFFVRYKMDKMAGVYNRGNVKEKEWVRKLKGEGRSYREIERITGIPSATVFRYVNE